MSFDDFWKAYPRKVGKLAASRAYDRALKHATAEQIQSGLESFLEAKPWGDDMQFCPHPTTWLNQGRWDDEHIEPKVELDWWERMDNTKRIREEVKRKFDA